uniref:G_PROTEIN_RECEP_F1_2 domain-containing protein n=1 Tax=Macrostomum lignano TaxID=282301 RepID=A0A1I8F6T0_9PLAT
RLMASRYPRRLSGCPEPSKAAACPARAARTLAPRSSTRHSRRSGAAQLQRGEAPLGLENLVGQAVQQAVAGGLLTQLGGHQLQQLALVVRHHLDKVGVHLLAVGGLLGCRGCRFRSCRLRCHSGPRCRQLSAQREGLSFQSLSASRLGLWANQRAADETRQDRNRTEQDRKDRTGNRTGTGQEQEQDRTGRTGNGQEQDRKQDRKQRQDKGKDRIQDSRTGQREQDRNRTGTGTGLEQDRNRTSEQDRITGTEQDRNRQEPGQEQDQEQDRIRNSGQTRNRTGNRPGDRQEQGPPWLCCCCLSFFFLIVGVGTAYWGILTVSYLKPAAGQPGAEFHYLGLWSADWSRPALSHLAVRILFVRAARAFAVRSPSLPASVALPLRSSVHRAAPPPSLDVDEIWRARLPLLTLAEICRHVTAAAAALEPDGRPLTRWRHAGRMQRPLDRPSRLSP